MRDLIERLEKATGPDRELDKAIRVACGYPPKPWNYTASLDAALSLAPDDHDWIIGNINGQVGGTPYACVGSTKEYYGATPAIALCIAALKARMAAERDLTKMEAGK